MCVCVCVSVAGIIREFNTHIVPYECRKLRTFSVYIQVSYISLKPFRWGAVWERGNWFIYMIFNFVFPFQCQYTACTFHFIVLIKMWKCFLWQVGDGIKSRCWLYTLFKLSVMQMYTYVFFLIGTIHVFAGYQPFEPIKIGWILICLLLTCQAKYFLQYLYIYKLEDQSVSQKAIKLVYWNCKQIKRKYLNEKYWY